MALAKAVPKASTEGVTEGAAQEIA